MTSPSPAIPAHRTGSCRSGDVTLSYRRLGKPGATPIVFVHGLSYFSWDWLGIAQAVAGGREAVCLDMRGFGDSTWSAAKDYSVPTMGEDLARLLDHLGWEKAVVSGHSMAARSSIFAAAKHPARVAGLVLVDFSPESSPAGTRRIASIVAAIPDAFASLEDAMAYFKADPGKRARFEAYLKPAPGGFAVKRDPHFRDQFRKMLETGERPKLGVDMWQLLGEVRCPILSMRGARSDMYLAETMPRMLAANSRLRVAEIDAGHNIAGDNPQGYLAALQPFLDSLDGKSREH